MRTRLAAGDKELKRAICGVASVRCTKTGAASLSRSMFALGGREANVRVSGSELPVSDNSLFNGVNHCGVQVSTPHSVGFARLASEAFYCAV